MKRIKGEPHTARMSLEHLRERARSSHARRLGAVVGGVLLLFLCHYSFSRVDLEYDHRRFATLLPLVMLLETIPIALSAFLTILIAKSFNKSLSFRQSLKSSIYGGVANFLPIPGAFLARAHILNATGLRPKSNLRALGIIAISNVLTSLAFAAFAVASFSLVAMGVSALFALASFALIHIGLQMKAQRSFSLSLLTFSLALFAIALSGIRLSLIGYMFRLPINPVDAMALSLSGALSNLIGLFPSGLGIQELIAVGLSQATETESPVAISLIVFDKSLRLICLVSLGFSITIRNSRRIK